AAAAAEGRAALIPYVTAGHPSPELAPDVLAMLADEGADVIELGVPFSDPLADGPTIQRSSFQAIARGVDLRWTLEALAEFRRGRDTPVVVFTYLNPVLRYGVERFLADAADAGADGVLLTDLPTGADGALERRFAASPLDLIRLVAPTTRPERVREIARGARGFLYYVSRTGVTGARRELAAGLAREVAAVRAAAQVPVAVGFGVSTPAHAATVAALADGVVVGSALVDRLSTAGVEGGRELVRALRRATFRVTPS
ncbi:MAG TPA: tryptophan synthase subunit alpha, partial [Longimicrobiaceae bacterium]|nr:tryptophan synthase subunit alpha [Longimicrobiaceae bacterium]